MSSDYYAEVSEPITTAAGTFRVRVDYDTEGLSPRDDESPTGTIVCDSHAARWSHRELPREGDLLREIDDACERRGWSLAARYLSVVHGAVVLPIYGTDRLSTGELGETIDDGSSVTGVIYVTRAHVRAEWGPDFTDAEIARQLAGAVQDFESWAHGEMYAFVIERPCCDHKNCCDLWVETEEITVGGYYSAEEAMAEGRYAVPTEAESAERVEPGSVAAGLIAEAADGTIAALFEPLVSRIEDAWTARLALSEDAVAVIAGLVTENVNTAGIKAPDAVWAEIRWVFPSYFFRAWATDANYDPGGGAVAAA